MVAIYIQRYIVDPKNLFCYNFFTSNLNSPTLPLLHIVLKINFIGNIGLPGDFHYMAVQQSAVNFRNVKQRKIVIQHNRKTK